MTEGQEHWYAAKVLYKRQDMLVRRLESRGIRWYAPEDLISSLIFFHSTEADANELRKDAMPYYFIYRNAAKTALAVIPDKEMEVFIFVTSAGDKGLEFLGDDKPEYHLGDRVRVTGGIFEGAEGHVKRIRRDRRLVITLSGVAAVATSFIPPALLQKIPEPDQTTPEF